MQPVLVKAPVRLGFLDGVKSLGRAVGFVAGTPAHWPLAMVPVAVAGTLTALLSVLGLWGSVHAARALAQAHAGSWGLAAAWAVGLLLGVGAVVLALLLALSLAQPLSGVALDALSRRQMVALGHAPPPEEPFAASALRSIAVTLAGLAAGLPVLALLTLLEVVVPVLVVVTAPLKLGLSALMIAWDFLDYPLSLHGVAVRDRVRWMRANLRAVMGFGVASAVLLFVPGLQLLLLPVGVAGATRLVVAAGRQGA